MTLVSEPGHYNIRMSQGATFHLMLTWKDGNGDPVDLTGASGSLPVMKKTRTTVAPYEELDLAHTFATAPGSGMTLGGVAGTITLDATSTITDGFDWDDAVYDLFIQFPGGDVVRLLDGHVVLAKKLG